MKTVTSLQNRQVKDAVSLHQKKYRDELGVFLVEGEEPCLSAIQNGWECACLFVMPAKAGIHVDPGLRRDDKVIEVTPEILAKISKKDNPQDVIGVFKQRVFDAPEKTGFILALEEIRDPGNLGTIMRTAHAVNVKHIVLVGPCCDAFAPEVIRSSMGSFSAIHLSQMSPQGLVEFQQKNHMKLIGTDVVDAVDYRQADYINTILVMGNEQKGLSAELKKHCTSCVNIPMPGGTESLNLSIATGLLLYQATNPA